MGEMVGNGHLDGCSPVADKGVFVAVKALSKHIKYKSASDVVRLYPLGDLHLGHVLFDEDLFKETVAKIADDPLAVWIGLGDMTECITRNDFRHMESSYAPFLHGEDDVVQVQRKRLLKLLTPIASQCIGYLEGNHELKLRQKDGRDIYQSVVEALISEGAEPPIALGAQGFVRLYLQRHTRTGRKAESWAYTVYARHGFGGGRLEGSLPLKLGRLLKSYLADLYLFGHHHREVLLRGHRVSMKVGSDEIQGTDVFMLGTGSFLKGYDETGKAEVYSESAGYSPLTIGAPTILITPDNRQVQVVI